MTDEDATSLHEMAQLQVCNFEGDEVMLGGCLVQITGLEPTETRKVVHNRLIVDDVVVDEARALKANKKNSDGHPFDKPPMSHSPLRYFCRLNMTRGPVRVVTRGELRAVLQLI